MENKQFTLGQLIKELEGLDFTNNDSGDPKEVYYDFAYFKPTFLTSWRGSYEQLALGYDSDKICFAVDLMQDLKKALSESFEGWKGGTYYMNNDTIIWVAQPNESCNTGIVGVIDEGHRIVLLTSYFDY